MKLGTLRQLYINELRDLYSAENQLIKALPKMVKAAPSEELREALEEPLEQTNGHVDRLEQVFARLDEKPKGKTWRGMKFLLKKDQKYWRRTTRNRCLMRGFIVTGRKWTTK
jgi:ferritin-like metal-binding protein YciE